MTPRERVAAAYDANYDVMRFTARRCNVPPADVGPLIHDVFIAFMRHSASIADDRGWLVTAIRNACRNYWRDQKGEEPVADILPDTRRLADDVAARVDIALILAQIPVRCRRVLVLRYVDGLAPHEIAALCAASTSPGYGRQLVHRCLRAAREALSALKVRT